MLVRGIDLAKEVLDAIGLKDVTGIREIHLHIVPDDIVTLEVIRYPSHDQIMDMTKTIKDTYVLLSKEKIDKGELLIYNTGSTVAEIEDDAKDDKDRP